MTAIAACFGFRMMLDRKPLSRWFYLSLIAFVLGLLMGCTDYTAPAQPCIANAVHVVLQPGQTFCVTVSYH